MVAHLRLDSPLQTGEVAGLQLHYLVATNEPSLLLVAASLAALAEFSQMVKYVCNAGGTELAKNKLIPCEFICQLPASVVITNTNCCFRNYLNQNFTSKIFKY
jgi:hypothetical protein